MKIAIVDDEASIRETTRMVLKHYYSEFEIHEAGSVAEGIQLVKTLNPDLLFLDVEMGDGTGFDLLTRIPGFKSNVVFVTAHNDYAVKAFKFSALDYILKPVNPEEIKAAVEKALGRNTGSEKKLNTFIDNMHEGKLERIVLTDLSGINIIELKDIVHCQSIGNYTHFFLSQDKELVISTTLKHYDELLSEHGFFRIHQSHLINLTHLSKFSKNDGGEVIMKDGSIIPVSTRKKEALLELLKKLRS